MLLMLVLHLISIASHSARDEPITIELLLLLISFKLEGNAMLSISEASVDILIVDLPVKGSGLALAEAWQITIIG